jgi:uncharacterized membrane protein
MKKIIITLFLTVIVLMGLVFRLGPVLEERDYWYDEAFTGILLKQSWGEMNQMIFADVHPPLYYWLAKSWASLADYSPFAIRSFSLFMGLLIIISVYWIGRKMFDERAGLLAALITAISPFAIQYSQEARMYALFGFLMIWATWFFYRALKFDHWKDWIGWGIFGGLAYLTHYLSLFFFLIFFVTAVFYECKFNKTVFRKALFLTKKFWAGTGVIFLFFLAWMPFFIPHMLKGNLGWIGVSYLSDVPKTLQIFLLGHPLGAGGVPDANPSNLFFDASSLGLLVLVGIFVLLTLAWKRKTKREEFSILTILSIGTLVFLIVLSHFNLKLYVSRYFMPAAIMTYLLIAGMTTTVFKKAYSWLIFLAIFALLILNLKPIEFSSHWYQASQMVKNEIPKNYQIITTSPFDYTSMRYYIGTNRLKYYHKANPTEDFSKWVVVGNENRLTTLEEIKALENFVIFDGDCNWEGIELEEIGNLGNLKVCQ